MSDSPRAQTQQDQQLALGPEGGGCESLSYPPPPAEGLAVGPCNEIAQEWHSKSGLAKLNGMKAPLLPPDILQGNGTQRPQRRQRRGGKGGEGGPQSRGRGQHNRGQQQAQQPHYGGGGGPLSLSEIELATAALGPADADGAQIERMCREFKTIMCNHEGSMSAHDQRCCPFYHGERDRRRSPLSEDGGGGETAAYIAEPCDKQFDDQRRCSRGDQCGLCHSTAELLYHPDFFRKRLCHQAKRCPRGRCCAFAHSRQELLVPHFSEAEETMPTEEFIAYKFKTQWCPIGGPHDWENCVYAHTYRDWRRVPLIGYSSRPCQQWTQSVANGPPELTYADRCPRGMACPLAHGAKEQLYHPQFYKTSPCSEANCKRGTLCAFTHGPHDLWRHNADEQSTTRSAREPIPGVDALLLRYQPTYWNPPRYHALEEPPKGGGRGGFAFGGGGGMFGGNTGAARSRRQQRRIASGIPAPQGARHIGGFSDVYSHSGCGGCGGCGGPLGQSTGMPMPGEELLLPFGGDGDGEVSHGGLHALAAHGAAFGGVNLDQLGVQAWAEDMQEGPWVTEGRSPWVSENRGDPDYLNVMGADGSPHGSHQFQPYLQYWVPCAETAEPWQMGNMGYGCYAPMVWGPGMPQMSPCLVTVPSSAGGSPVGHSPQAMAEANRVLEGLIVDEEEGGSTDQDKRQPCPEEEVVSGLAEVTRSFGQNKSFGSRKIRVGDVASRQHYLFRDGLRTPSSLGSPPLSATPTEAPSPRDVVAQADGSSGSSGSSDSAKVASRMAQAAKSTALPWLDARGMPTSVHGGEVCFVSAHGPEVPPKTSLGPR